MKEITIAVIGHVDNGKSTTIGVLTDSKNNLDNGRGMARTRIMNYPHEKESGRTSSLGHTFVKEDGKIINYIDTAGHEKYLKTTIRGITSYQPDYAILCVSKNITNITREHLKLILMMKIPFMFLITKIDIVPKNIRDNNIKILKKYAQKVNKKIYKVNDQKDVELVTNLSKSLIPMIEISNVTGKNITLLKSFVKNIDKLNHHYYPCFVIDNVYRVKGYGIIITGVTGIELKKGDDIYIGPVGNGKEFIKTRIRTIHNDYKEFVDQLNPGTRGCLWIKWDNSYPYIRSGMIAMYDTNDITVTKTFRADVMIFHHSSTIKVGYQAYANIGAIKTTVTVEDIDNENKSLRSGQRTSVVLSFMKHHNYVELGTEFFFRESTTRGIGRITELIN